MTSNLYNFWSDDAGMGMCACAQPSVLIERVLAYLVTSAEEDAGGCCKVADDNTLVIAYLCDMRELTDHGGSVYAAWLTDKGEALLAAAGRLRARGDDPGGEDVWSVLIEGDEWPIWEQALPLVGVAEVCSL